jgi:hypothetical protein
VPPRDLALEVPWHFILVYLVVGPFFGGVLLAVATHWLRTVVRRLFDRAAFWGLPIIILVSLLLAPRSHGASLLFILPYAMLLLGVMLFRLAFAPQTPTGPLRPSLRFPLGRGG